MINRLKTVFMLCLLCLILILSGCSDNGSQEQSQQSSETTSADTSSVANPDNSNAVANNITLNLQGPGNTPANLLNGGIAAEYDGYIYHTDRMMWGNLCRTPINGGMSELLQKGTFHDININSDTIFVIGSVSNQDTGIYADGIFRMNTDGSNLQMIKEGYFEQLILYDSYLYYIDTMDSGLYRIKYDGTDDKLLLENIYDDFTIIDSSLYVCAELDEEYVQSVYKMPLDASATPVMVIKDIFGGGINAANSFIYYIARDNSSNTYRYNTATGESEVFYPQWIDWLNTDGEYLYYFWNGLRADHTDEGLYRINLDGSGEQMVMASEEFFSMNIAGGKIFWHNNDDQRRLTVMNLDGSDMTFVELIPD